MTAMCNSDISTALQQQVQDAYNNGSPLTIVGGGSKLFLGNIMDASAQQINVSEHRGIVEYDPRELVLTARSAYCSAWSKALVCSRDATRWRIA